MNKFKKKIFWIASYPKSGNTWMRAIISSLFYTKDGKFNFTNLKNVRYFDRQENYMFIKSLNNNDFNNLSDLTVISKYWTEAQKKVKILNGNFGFFKTHSANMQIENFRYTNENNTLGLIYLIRDPRDVAISYSQHKGVNIDEIIKVMQNERISTFSGDSYPVMLSSWNHHYFSWFNLKVPKLIIKYEKLLNNTENVLWNIVDFFNQNYDVRFNNAKTKINNIIKTTSFEKLQNHEKIYGFKEARKSMFFRKGSAMQWKNELSYSQINKIEISFKSAMKELNYI